MAEAADSTESGLSTSSDSTTSRISGIDSIHMKRAALYARVSSDLQAKEGTIQSQVSELRRHIAAAGHVLVKEYIDDGVPGPLLDRPALNQLREDIKTTTFDAVFFLDADRIARKQVLQTIIIDEILKNGKQVIIKGKDYVKNPENTFTLQVLGAVAEFEHAKITERMTRGKMHRLRQGYLLGNGFKTYGYTYIPRTREAPAAMFIKPNEAAVIRHIFETYAQGDIGLNAIAKHLETLGTPTNERTPLWTNWKLKYILRNRTYAGTRYFNKCRCVLNDKTGTYKKVQTERSEWIGIKVPAIVSEEVFERAQERLAKNARQYRNPKRKQLLCQLIECGVCGHRFHAYQRYLKQRRMDGSLHIYHKAAYRCNWRQIQKCHAKEVIARCDNPEVSAVILVPMVFDMVRNIMLDPQRIRLHMDLFTQGVHESELRIEREVANIDKRVRAIKQEKKRIVDIYASGDLSREDYVKKNLAYDDEGDALERRKVELLRRIPYFRKRDIIDTGIAQFCQAGRARLDLCGDFESKRRFLLDSVEKIVYREGLVQLSGSVPIQVSPYVDLLHPGETTRLPFCIERRIEREEMRLIRRRTRRSELHEPTVSH